MPFIIAVMDNSKEEGARLYSLRWKAFLVNLASEIFGAGFYDVHAQKTKTEGKRTKPRVCFGILRGYSVNGSVARETLSRWKSDMNSDDLDKASDAIEKYWTYLQECAERVHPSVGVWWNPSPSSSGSCGTQFFRESDGGLSDKYLSIDQLVSSINAMGANAGFDEDGMAESRIFDEQAIQSELSRLFEKYYGLLWTEKDSCYDGAEKEEWYIASLNDTEKNANNGTEEPPHFNYKDGRYTKAPLRVFWNWNSSSGESFFAWPIREFKRKCLEICGDDKVYSVIMKKLFGEKKGLDGEAVDDVKNIEDIIRPKDVHVRKWSSFEDCFVYYSRGRVADDSFKFTSGILGKESSGLTERQIDDAFLAFLTFQSEMMAAYLLENTRAVLLNHLSPETVEGIFSSWREKYPNPNSKEGK